jgi:hypothetical protein
VRHEPATNGSAVAAILAAAIGSMAMGAVVVLNEAGVFAAPTLYGPAGGVTGRTSLATLIWLVAWGVLHARWKSRDVRSRSLYPISMVLIVLGILGTFPPVWKLL